MLTATLFESRTFSISVVTFASRLRVTFFFFLGASTLIAGFTASFDGADADSFSTILAGTSSSISLTNVSPNSPFAKLKIDTYPSELVTNSVFPSADQAASVKPA